MCSLHTHDWSYPVSLLFPEYIYYSLRDLHRHIIIIFVVIYGKSMCEFAQIHNDIYLSLQCSTNNFHSLTDKSLYTPSCHLVPPQYLLGNHLYFMYCTVLPFSQSNIVGIIWYKVFSDHLLCNWHFNLSIFFSFPILSVIYLFGGVRNPCEQ